jgi:hypothetical protein
VKDEMRLLKRTLRGWVPFLAVLATAACVDDDDRCGSQRVLDPAEVCVRKPGTVDRRVPGVVQPLSIDGKRYTDAGYPLLR